MATPSTGTTWDGAGLGNVDNRFLERGKLVQALIRDNQGANTNISPHNMDGSVNFSPFALDGNWRPDLFAFNLTNGFWTPNPTANLGFHLVGAMKDGVGPNTKPTIRNDHFMIVQSNMPFDSDLTEEAEPFGFQGVETAKPLMRRLRNNLPLVDASGNLLVDIPGDINAGWGKPIDSDNVSRQVLLVRQYTKNGLPVYTVEGYSLCVLDNIGASKKDKKDSEAAELTWLPLPDPFFMALVDGVYRPVLKYTWVGGPGWTAQGGTPSVSSTPPVATAGATGKASFTFPDPTGPDAPYTGQITAQYATTPFTSWSTATLDTPGAVTESAGTTTVKVKSLTSASSVQLRAVVTADNGATATSPASNTITIA
jgi:hypothetical protein